MKLFDEVEGNTAWKFKDDGTNEYDVRVNCQPRDEQKEAVIMATIAAQAARIATLERLLSGYFEKYDDISLPDIAVKRWLDDIWIPEARRALEATK